VTREDTLLELFAPPDGLSGHTAALVAMTASEDFLDEAMERFTGLRARERSRLGRVQAYLMLDPHESSTRRAVLRPGQVPGMHELHPRPVPAKSLLHAKLALLAFAATPTGPVQHLRLAVLTANFTRTSARHQLEHAVVIDVRLAPAAAAADRLDIGAAAAFVRMLVDRRFQREAALTDRLDALLTTAEAVAPERGRPRFIHSLEKPLFEQIKQRFRATLEPGRNILVCGSGFYEQPVPGGHKPDVLAELEALAPASARRYAVVEPTQAGAIAAWAKRAGDDGWLLRAPSDPLGLQRRLHAKYVYVGYLRDGHLSKGCAYVGSGNLSRRGLLTSGQMDDGNIETGMVLWVPDRLGGKEVTELLFWDMGIALMPEPTVGDVGDGPEDEALITTPPILSAAIVVAPARGLRLRWAEDAAAEQVSLRWPGRTDVIVARGQPDVPLADAETPAAVEVSDGSRWWTIPVVDPAGRVSWEAPRFDSYADALGALTDFPLRPAEADDDDEHRDHRDAGDDDDADSPGGLPGTANGADDAARTYALHAAAELIEEVAALQRGLDAGLIDDWLDHLDRTLSAAFPPALIDTWRAYRLDVCRHLAAPALRPPRLTDGQRRRYESILDRTAIAWGLR